MTLKLEMTGIVTDPTIATWVDMTAFLAYQSVTIKMNSLDFTLIDPTGTPPMGGATGLLNDLFVNLGSSWNGGGGAAAFYVRVNAGWQGTLTSVRLADIVDLRNGHDVWTFTAVRIFVMPTSANQPGMVYSDAPSAIIDDYLLEDGSGHYLLEDGSFTAPGAYQIEGGSFGYAQFSFTNRLNQDGTTQFFGELTTYQPGLWPGDQFTLTSTNSGASSLNGGTFYVTEISVTFPTALPAYRVTFSKVYGDIRRTFQAFVAAQGT